MKLCRLRDLLANTRTAVTSSAGFSAASANASKLLLLVVGLVSLMLVPLEVLARVGGGGSYSGGGGHGGSGGGGGGGAIIWLIFQLIRLLAYLTIEYPAVGIPLDIL